MVRNMGMHVPDSIEAAAKGPEPLQMDHIPHPTPQQESPQPPAAAADTTATTTAGMYEYWAQFVVDNTLMYAQLTRRDYAATLFGLALLGGS